MKNNWKWKQLNRFSPVQYRPRRQSRSVTMMMMMELAKAMSGCPSIPIRISTYPVSIQHIHAHIGWWRATKFGTMTPCGNGEIFRSLITSAHWCIPGRASYHTITSHHKRPRPWPQFPEKNWHDGKTLSAVYRLNQIRFKPKMEDEFPSQSPLTSMHSASNSPRLILQALPNLNLRLNDTHPAISVLVLSLICYRFDLRRNALINIGYDAFHSLKSKHFRLLHDSQVASNQL